MKKRVVSIALFGERADHYATYLKAFVRGHLNLFPDWELRVHIDFLNGSKRPYWWFLLHAYEHARLLSIAYKTSAPLTKAMLWRLEPIFDPNVEFVFSRDIDAPPMPRDRACCDHFINTVAETRCSVHSILDNEVHCNIMGGLSGYHAPSFRKVTGFRHFDNIYMTASKTDEQWAKHGTDQIALNQIVLRKNGPRLFEHRFNGWSSGPEAKPKRSPGIYPCGGVSSPVPNDGSRKWAGRDASDELIAMADRLGNHLGCAGYDHEAAVKFWNQYGELEIMHAVKECET